ncbi:MAG: O-antigen polysaccharide polymerase Wzy family protein [Prevotella sp.]|nr:O-antigen polysaccharide polymerase Wzy family protein [Prevotella sp.]
MILFVFTIVFFTGYFTDNQTTMGIALLLLFCYVVFFAIRKIDKHITLLVFAIAFFTFLMGRMILPIFYDTSNLIYDIGGANFSNETISHMDLSLFLALLFVYIGYKYVYREKYYEKEPFNRDELYVQNVRNLSRKLMYMTFPVALLLTLEKVYLVLTMGYVAMYIDFQSSFPYFVTLIGGWFYHAFFIFLATLPSKKEAKIPLSFYVTISILSLATGQRGSFVLGLLFVVMYLFLRNSLQTGDGSWIGRRGIIAILVSLPLMVSFLFLMVYIRSDRDRSMSENLLISFFYQQGVSAEVIGYTYDYENRFPEGKVYLLGDVTDYFRHNIFARLLFGAKSAEPQSVEHALEDNSLDAALTYFVKPDLYLSGGGLGGCYVAEAWKDLGYFGICLVSFLYGLLLAKIPLWCRKNFWIGSVGLVMFNQIIFAPRAHAIKPIYVFFSLNVIIVYAYLYIASKRRGNRVQVVNS